MQLQILSKGLAYPSTEIALGYFTMLSSICARIKVTHYVMGFLSCESNVDFVNRERWNDFEVSNNLQRWDQTALVVGCAKFHYDRKILPLSGGDGSKPETKITRCYRARLFYLEFY